MSDFPEWTPLADIADFAGERKLVRSIYGIDLLLMLDGADVVVAHNHCTHMGRPLDRGKLMAGQISCPFHGACFDLRTGAARSGPAVAPLHLFPARVDGQTIYADLRNKPVTLWARPT
ncbi:MAG: nirD [Hydrocarboniphaga sp.]|uniref:Rieske (2Fe-2S) protein n=1 Tax=Hydrocarboniphaga sp. TaxID=2033016 RepID=UPI0026244693|nr:Rieske (2Fe-2S) protein [Hydrocarboniphaga sp.]MDB5968375.1 nirD [Hydrocarboniphaga sp.]